MLRSAVAGLGRVGSAGCLGWGSKASAGCLGGRASVRPCSTAPFDGSGDGPSYKLSHPEKHRNQRLVRTQKDLRTGVPMVDIREYMVGREGTPRAGQVLLSKTGLRLTQHEWEQLKAAAEQIDKDLAALAAGQPHATAAN